ncbi:MAG: pyridoxal phosphate-dependent aminotransferase [Proteobacteria bacterium]|nr:pyridoxal phosphate-dependent aminotransferase [Pseudomonadota bacterium]
MSFFAHRLSMIKPSSTLEISAKAAALKASGHDVIGLGAGEPDFDTPEFIKQAALKALERGETKYTAVEGTLSLRKAICQKFLTENDLIYDPSEIIVSCGGKHVIFNAMISTLNPGDEVIIPAPYWVSYLDIVLLFGGVPKIIQGGEDNNFKITPNLLEEMITPKTKWVILNSPSNPTGMCYDENELKALGDVLKKYPSVWILSDDIYEHLIFDGLKFKTLAQVVPDLKSRILIVNGVSKTYAMTGWRIGYGAAPKELISSMKMVQSQCTSNATSIAQAAAEEALKGDQTFLKERQKIFEERRNRIVDLLNACPFFSCLKPQGAFYVYPSVKGIIGKKTPQGKILTTDSDVATYFLDSVGVAVVPGEAFGLSPYVRISYATSMGLLEEACARLKKAVEQLV